MATRPVLMAVAVLALAGCAEKEQTAAGVKTDAPAYRGTGMPYAAPGWKPGDKTSWEQALRTRTQLQNEYGRVN
jgi:hypothetical protein